MSTKKVKLIGLLAKRHRGKDTTADYLVKYGFIKRAFAEPLKKGVQIWFNFSDKQLYTDMKEEIDPFWGISPRYALQTAGVFARDTFDKNFWVTSFDKWYKETYDDHKGYVVVSDVRFQNEVDYIKSQGGIVVKIERPILDEKKGDTQTDKHVSETEIDNIANYDRILWNDGEKNELYFKIDEMMKSLTGRV